MADTPVREHLLAEATALVAADYIRFVADKDGSPVSKIISRANARKSLFDSLVQGDILYHNGTDIVRLAAGTSGRFLKTLGAAANPAWASQGYTLQGVCYQFNPADGASYYVGNSMPYTPLNAPGYDYIDVPKAGTLTAMYVRWKGIGGVAGSNENVSAYIGKNAGDYTLIETIGDTNDSKVFNKSDLALAVAAGDALDVKIVCPTWGTNPTNVNIKWTAWIETP